MTKEKLDGSINYWKDKLHIDIGSKIDPGRILWAIANVESTYGKQNDATHHEGAYHYGGHYYKRSRIVREQSQKWGCLAHSSFGSFQILFITAYELGFRGDPIELRDPDISLRYVVKLINRRVLDKLSDEKPIDIFDAYNSGTPRDRIVPEQYIDKALIFYNEKRVR